MKSGRQGQKIVTYHVLQLKYVFVTSLCVFIHWLSSICFPSQLWQLCQTIHKSTQSVCGKGKVWATSSFGCAFPRLCWGGGCFTVWKVGCYPLSTYGSQATELFVSFIIKELQQCLLKVNFSGDAIIPEECLQSSGKAICVISGSKPPGSAQLC